MHDEIQHIISGKSEIRFGESIQAVKMIIQPKIKYLSNNQFTF